MVALVDLATVLSFLTASVLAWLNHRVILAVDEALQLGRHNFFHSIRTVSFVDKMGQMRNFAAAVPLASIDAIAG